MSKCTYCGGSGITREDPTYCKHCGTHAGAYSTSNHEVTAEVNVDLNIPSYYAGKTFDLIAFSTAVQRRFRTLNRVAFDSLKNRLVQLLSMTEENKPLSKSILLQLPEIYETNLYLFNLIETIHSHRISIHPLITLTELSYVIKYKEQGMKFLLDAEYVIIKVDHIPYILDDVQSLAYILNTRGCKDKVTIVVSPVAIANWGNIFQGVNIGSYIKVYTNPNEVYTKDMLIPVPSLGNIYHTTQDGR